MSILERGLPVDVFERFPNINFTETNKAIDEEHFAWLLSNCPKLLFLSREFLSQSLLNQPPVVSKNLEKLLIAGNRNGAAPLDLSPLYELRLLTSLQIRSDDAKSDGVFDLGVLLEKCRYIACIFLDYIELSKGDDGYQVIIKKPIQGDLGELGPKSQLIFLGDFTDRILKSNLDRIIQKCNELSHGFAGSDLIELD